MRKMTSSTSNAAPTRDPMTIPAIAPPDKPVGGGRHLAEPELNCAKDTATVLDVPTDVQVGVAEVVKHGGSDVAMDDTCAVFTD